MASEIRIETPSGMPRKNVSSGAKQVNQRSAEGGSVLIMTIFVVPDRWRHRLILRPGWIEIAEAAIAADHRRLALLDALEFAVPDHISAAEILHRAPRRIADRAGAAWRGEKQQQAAECGGQEYRRSESRRSAHCAIVINRYTGKRGYAPKRRLGIMRRRGWLAPRENANRGDRKQSEMVAAN
jgi:hypothetical protein